MKQKRVVRMGSMLLAMVFALGLCMAMPLSAMAVEMAAPSATQPAKNVSAGTVYYGGNLYRVVANDGTTMTLWMNGSLSLIRRYDDSEHKSWSGSLICIYLNNTFLVTAFTGAEQNAINTYGTTETTNGHTIDIDQKIVLPSLEEVQDVQYGGTWGMTDANRTYNASYWWLRSPGLTALNFAAFIYDSGTISINGLDVSNDLAIRPAFKLNLSSVLFTSAASGASGKSAATVGSGTLEAATQTTGAVKLTVIDDTNLSVSVTDTSARTALPGDTLSIDYTGARTGTGRSVSVLLCDTSGNPLYYGRPSDATSGIGSGTASFAVPAGLAAGSYTLKIFNEEVNGNNLTDFASTPVNISLTVLENTPPTISAVTPNGAAEPLSGNIVITFDEAMNPASGLGSVSLSGGGTVTAPGAWSAGNTIYTIPYSGLANGTLYNLTISGFQDVAGNVMMQDTSKSFVTAAASKAAPPKVTKDFDTFTGTGTRTAIVDTDLSEFINLTLGGNIVATTNYDTEQGSTIITLHEDYLNTFSNGTYTFVANFTNGSVNLPITINNTANPRTGDDIPLGLLITLIVVAGAGMTLGIRRRFVKS